MKYVLVNGIILDGTKEMETIQKYIVVEDGKIVAITDTIPENIKKIDYVC